MENHLRNTCTRSQLGIIKPMHSKTRIASDLGGAEQNMKWEICLVDAATIA